MEGKLLLNVDTNLPAPGTLMMICHLTICQIVAGEYLLLFQPYWAWSFETIVFICFDDMSKTPTSRLLVSSILRISREQPMWTPPFRTPRWVVKLLRPKLLQCHHSRAPTPRTAWPGIPMKSAMFIPFKMNVRYYYILVSCSYVNIDLRNTRIAYHKSHMWCEVCEELLIMNKNVRRTYVFPIDMCIIL